MVLNPRLNLLSETFFSQSSICSAFVPVMRAMWPGLYGNAGGSPHVISKRRKLAVQASRFMVQMVQTQLFSTESTDQASKSPESASGSVDASNNFDISEEGLAIRIAVEVWLNNLGKNAYFYYCRMLS